MSDDHVNGATPDAPLGIRDPQFLAAVGFTKQEIVELSALDSGITAETVVTAAILRVAQRVWAMEQYLKAKIMRDASRIVKPYKN